ncbi:hypothetical protein DOTSEDRAFT_43836 [Dothistroma septosporum NZE10]|uniref:Uncharacterized protein n=1 Tax=Dothistroma septosporum (strain NZE10 / CBS 128990) TaxID=675120 RepID=N1PQ50_DOTSN|nr:hypothetical protein DOTSEDRAFT_43836 [Dothistroma septosporum NZE10]
MQSKKRDLFTLGEDEIFYRFALCLVPQCLQQWRGSNLISSYSTTTFENGLLAIQFLVTIRFATNGPKFDVDKAMRTDNDEGSSLVYSKALMIILIVSRLVLVFQYLHPVWFTSHWDETDLPMLIIASTYLVAAIIYSGLFWSLYLSDTRVLLVHRMGRSDNLRNDRCYCRIVCLPQYLLQRNAPGPVYVAPHPDYSWRGCHCYSKAVPKKREVRRSVALRRIHCWKHHRSSPDPLLHLHALL